MAHRKQDHRKMTADQVRAALDQIGLRVDAFAWLYGCRTKRVGQWLSGEEAPPVHLDILFGLMTLPGAKDLILQVVRRQATTEELESLTEWEPRL